MCEGKIYLHKSGKVSGKRVEKSFSCVLQNYLCWWLKGGDIIVLNEICLCLWTDLEKVFSFLSFLRRLANNQSKLN